MPRTMRARLVIFQVAILALAALIVDLAVYRLVVTPLQADLDSSLYDQAKAVEGATVLDAGKLTFNSGGPPSTNDSGASFEVAVAIKDQLTPTAARRTSSNEQVLEAARKAVAADGGIYLDEVVGASHRRVYAETASAGTPDAPLNYVAIVTRSTDELRDTINRLVLTLAVGSLAVVAVGGLLASVVVGRSLRPVRRLAATAAGIGDRELNRRVENTTPDSELGELVGTFNGMLERLETSFEGLRQFTADASHELRGPLALMRTQVEVARTRDRTPLEYRELLARLDAEIRHLAAIADQLLLLARSDANALSPVREDVDVADLLHEEAQRWTEVANARDVKLEVVAPDQGRVQAQPDLLRRVIDNLVDNALRYAPSDSTVSVTGQQVDSTWVIEVADRGPGVPPELRPKLFRRFTRSDAARDPQSGHAGLGLAVSAAIVAAHGGKLELLEGGEDGATFRLTIPMAEV